MGFKDGTNNLKAEDAAALDRPRLGRRRRRRRGCAAAATSSRAASACCIETWDRSSLDDQEHDHRPRTRRRARRSASATSSTRSTSLPRRDGSRHPGRRAHPPRRARPPTAASGSCAAATPSPTASTRLGELDAGPVLHRLPARPAHSSSCRCSAGSAPTTRSTSTSRTPAARFSRAARRQRKLVAGPVPLRRLATCRSAPPHIALRPGSRPPVEPIESPRRRRDPDRRAINHSGSPRAPRCELRVIEQLLHRVRGREHEPVADCAGQ